MAVPVTGSPDFGKRDVDTTRSAFKIPTDTTSKMYKDTGVFDVICHIAEWYWPPPEKLAQSE